MRFLRITVEEAQVIYKEEAARYQKAYDRLNAGRKSLWEILMRR